MALYGAWRGYSWVTLAREARVSDYQCEGCGKTSRIAQHEPGCPVAAYWSGQRDSQRPTLDAGEVAASIERNTKALLLEVAPFALHGIGLAIFAAAEQPAHRNDRCAELCALKAKFEDWIAANR